MAGALLYGTIRAAPRLVVAMRFACSGLVDVSSPTSMSATLGAAPRAPALPSARPGWWGLTFYNAALLTAFDAFLIQEKKSFFTGGFLSADHATGLSEAVVFLLASFASDLAFVGLLAAIGLRAVASLRLTPLARTLAVSSLALAPAVISDFARYRLVSYLGDAFDLSLMFDLTGRSPNEMLAVAVPHLIAPALLLAGVGAAGGAMVWAVNRINSGRASRVRVPARVFLAAALTFAVTLTATTALRASSDVMENGLRRKPSGALLASVLEFISDVDRDGYGIGGFMRDPAPLDAAVYPHAPDAPGNGVDENGVGGDLPAASPAYTEAGAPVAPWRHKPDVILIVLESFRADAVGATLNGKAVTPALDELARQGVSVRYAYSHNGYTTQSRYHIMSGSLAGLRAGTLIDDFKANGYEVGYFSGQDESFGGAQHAVGFDRADVAFDARQAKDRRYSVFTTAGSLAVPHTVVHERVADFMARRDSKRPLFLYVNFHDTHYPYHHPGIQPLVSSAALAERQIEPSRAAALRETYLNTAANVDKAIGDTLRTIRNHLASAPAVIVTADHGESLFDEGFLGHGYALNDVQTRIPLVAADLPIVIEEPFAQIDLRDAIKAALAVEPTGDPTPVVRARADKSVFQYLGNLNRPRQVAFETGAFKTVYDFRTQLARVGQDQWRPVESLGKEASDSLLGLIHYWERMVLARGRTRRGIGE